LNKGMTGFIALSPGRCASANGMRVPTAAMLITPVTLVYPFHSWQIKLYPRPRARKGAAHAMSMIFIPAPLRFAAQRP
jgi:hypothetical protein